MQLENYTNINIFKRAFEQTQVSSSHDMIEHAHNHTKAAGPIGHQGFNPYQNNEGTVLGKWLATVLFYLSPPLPESLINQICCSDCWLGLRYVRHRH